jgi:crotonobetainyl-CoA:carnitine CoA-transferase CaiB-like acyl-CoA transferase
MLRQFTQASSEVAHPYPHVLENAAAFHVLSGTCAAVFHQRRTGEGQMVRLNYLHIGVWNNSLAVCWSNFRPSNIPILETPWQVRNWYPIPSYNSHTTKDNMEIQLLGLDIKVRI